MGLPALESPVQLREVREKGSTPSDSGCEYEGWTERDRQVVYLSVVRVGIETILTFMCLFITLPNLCHSAFRMLPNERDLIHGSDDCAPL